MTIEEFMAALNDPDKNDNALFARLVSEGMTLLNITDKDVAREFGISRPTVDRWKDGSASPHPYIRPLVFKWLKEKAKKDISWCVDPIHDSPCYGACGECQATCYPKYMFEGNEQAAIEQLKKNKEE